MYGDNVGNVYGDVGMYRFGAYTRTGFGAFRVWDVVRL